MPQQTEARRKPRAGKRFPLNMRTTKDLRMNLEKAAAKAGRSLAQEVELRLEHSFVMEKVHAETLQTETDMRFRLEDEVHRLQDQIGEREVLEKNIEIIVEKAVARAFSAAGIKTKGKTNG